jgi:type IV pilus assembly protein PilE
MKNQQGFSLIEMLIVVAIIGILVAVAVPSYQNSTLKTKRAEGKALLLEGAQRFERHFTQFNVYPTSIVTGAPADRTEIQMTAAETTSENGHYTLSLAAGTATTFTLRATPAAPHADPICNLLTLNNLGQKTENGTGTYEECWNR